MDYEHVVVYEDNEEDQADWASAKPPFGRHPGGRANLVFRNGAVRSVLPSDIDPTVPSKNARYWVP